MIPNKLREIDFSIVHSGGHIEIKGYQKGNLEDTNKTNFAGIDIVT